MTNETTQATNTEVQATENAPAVQNGGIVVAQKRTSYVAAILEQSQREFLEINEGMDLDYVRLADWLKLNKKGNYVDAADDTINYSDTIDVVVAQGEQRYMLWGADGSPESGQIVTAERTRDEAEAALGEFLAANPEAAARYSNDDIQLRYLCYLVPVATLEPGESPLVYVFDLPKGDTIGWGKYAKAVFDGKYKQIGIPRRTAINNVVTRFTSEERKNNNNESYLGTKFEPVGVFNPADYGLADNPVDEAQGAQPAGTETTEQAE